MDRRLKIKLDDYKLLKDALSTVVDRMKEAQEGVLPELKKRTLIWSVFYNAYDIVDKERCSYQSGHWLDYLPDAHMESATLTALREIYGEESHKIMRR